MLPRLDARLLYGYRVRGRHQDKSKDEEGAHDAAAIGHRCDDVRGGRFAFGRAACCAPSPCAAARAQWTQL